MKFREMFGAAEWIALRDAQPDSVLYRVSFEAEKPVAAELTIVGLGVFEACLNGRAVSADVLMPLNSEYARRDFLIGDKPFGEELAYRLYCPVYDVTALMETGENVLSVMTGPGWFSPVHGFRYGALPAYGKQRLCFSLKLTFADGSVRHVVSDRSVRVRPGFAVEASLHFGERHDYRLYPDGWMQKGYDASAWNEPETLEPLDTDYLHNDCPADRVVRSIRPTLVSEAGETRVYDCGENITGTPVLIIRAPEGEKVSVCAAERLNAEGRPDERHTHAQSFEVVSDGSRRTAHLRFTWLAFRYLEVVGEAEMCRVDVIHTDVCAISSFRSDNDTLNWLYDAFLRTQLNNMHMGIPSDCPHIERCGYTGDGELTCDAVMTMLDTQAFYKKWIGDISDCQDRLTGHVQYTAPYVHSGGGPGGWGCAIVEVPYQYYLHYGDESVLTALYPQMLRYFDYLDAHSEDGLVTSDRPGEWCLGDWCTPEKIAIPEPYVNTYFYIRSLKRVIRIARIVGREADVPALLEKESFLKARLTERFFDPATGDFAGNIQGANAFAVDAGLGDARTYRNMAQHYRETGCYDTGIFGTDIVTRLLFERGDGETAAALLTGSTVNGSFGSMRELGFSTLLEYWGDYARSDDHPMFGAVTRYLFQYLLGIRQQEDSCGWKRPLIAPVIVPQIGFAEGSVTTKQGKISVAWKKRAEGTLLTVFIPDGADALLSVGGLKQPLGAGVHTFEIS